MALSNNVIGAINLVVVLLSIPVIAVGFWLTTQPESSCISIIQMPIIIIGVLILVVALVGVIGAFWRISWLLILYFVAILILIVVLATLAVFTFMVTVRGLGHIEPNRAYLEYHLDDFSAWMRRRVESSYKWDRIRACLSSTPGLCSDLNQSYRMAQDFFNAHITPLQSGCCKPPTQCGYTFVNPTYWISPINNAADMDCLNWNNDQTQLCYSCDSCKAGLLAKMRIAWKKANAVLIITLVALCCVYLAGCCAFRYAKTEDLFRRYKQGYT